MGFFNKKASAKAGATDNVQSEPATVTPSEDVSNTNLVKETHPSTVVGSDKTPDASSVSSLEKEPVPVTNDATNLPTSTLDEKHEVDEKKAMTHEEIEAERNDGEDEAVYPGGVKLAIIVVALCLSVFLVALDNTIIATAIPKITDEFNSLGDVGWYASSYLLTTCALQLFFGKSVLPLFTAHMFSC